MVAVAPPSVNRARRAACRSPLDSPLSAGQSAPGLPQCTLRTRTANEGQRVKKSFWKGLVKYALGLGLLAWVVYRNWQPADGSPGLSDALGRPVQWGPFAVAGGFAAAAALSTFVRWWLLVRAVGLDFRLADGVRLGLVGYFFNTFLPGSVGGDFVKAWHIAREQNRRAGAVATPLFGRPGRVSGPVWLVAPLRGGVLGVGDEHIRRNAR